MKDHRTPQAPNRCTASRAPEPARVSVERRAGRASWIIGLFAALLLPTLAMAETDDSAGDAFRRAWLDAGLTDEQAIAHAVDRLGFGARPGMHEQIASQGLARWLEVQLEPPREEPRVSAALSHLDALTMSSRELAETFPSPGMVLREMRAMEGDGNGRRPRRGSDGSREGEEQPLPNEELDPRELLEYSEAQGYRRRQELTAQLLTQKLIRATETGYPLREMLVDFWFNHFNVSVRDPEGGGQVLAYERDAIRPHVLGDFRTMLEATARHPAMLGYLDNATSRAEPGQRTAMSQSRGGAYGRTRGGGMGGRNRGTLAGSGRGGFGASGRGMRGEAQARPMPPGAPGRNTGLNENYARELLELHTLGVDGGYSQDDVVEVARAFTGWTVIPPRVLEERLGGGSIMDRVGAAGFVVDGLFLFHPGFHDAEKKTVLGHRLAARRGIEDGRDVLDIVASHPATARHLSRKLATRFTSDDPSPALVAALSATFTRSNGDLTEWMRTLLARPEFWMSSGDKVRTPFEYVVAAIRALDGELRRPNRELFGALEAMGQLPYTYDAPTGFPDEASHWLGSGALLARMNFATSLVANDLGVRLRSSVSDLAKSAYEDGGTGAALEAVVTHLLPGRNVRASVQELEPLVAEFEGESDLLESIVAWTIGSPAFQQR